MNEIDLYSEAKPRYHQLIPKREDGLVIFALFQRYQQREFTEQQIIQVIEQVLADLGKSGQRTENDRNNQVILRLQDFFLWRDRKRKVYGFKQYGAEFCLKVYQRLSESYHPARIERILKGLLETLRTQLTAAPLELPFWIQDQFEPHSGNLALQIEILDQQVNESVDLFRKEIKMPQTDIIALIDTISAGLDGIKQHAAELTIGFQVTYDIDDELQPLLKDPAANPVILHIDRVLRYNQELRSHLDQISNRIDKIKPQVREFIFKFNLREMDRKTDKFIHHLLDHSHYTRNSDQARRLVLPVGIPAPLLSNPEYMPRFCIVPLRELARRSPIRPTFRVVNEIATDEMVIKHTIRLDLKKRVQAWTEKALDLIKTEGSLHFSPFFFDVLRAEQDNLNVPVKVAQRLIKQCSDRHRYLISVAETTYHDPNYLNLSLWNMTISIKR
jgi:hypothetical protein